MRKYFFSIVFGLLFSIPSAACLNGETKKLKDGTEISFSHPGMVPRGHHFYSAEELNKMMKNLEKEYKKTKDIDYLSDKGYILIILHQYNEAIDLYKEIERIKPGRYSTASNIGTAYELAGDNRKALQWIEKSVVIDPDSHSGSEWIHVNILKSKMNGDQFLTSQFLLNTDFGTEKVPMTKLSKYELQQLRKALFYQLNERVSFVHPKDQIVAQLIFDLGNISFLLSLKNEALEDYRRSELFGFQKPLLKERIISVSKINNKIESKQNLLNESTINLMYTILSVLAISFSGLVVFIFRKKIILMLK
ncbi:tetratricopeptide repeat protein [Chryseobacterium sp. JUb7]|uniref:tetratricopeptide repeat protein n=1 Tax=Chryseobacterium sp. JUb7 TaxID=2940599 RepID=UPI002169C266|nr:tetratricopeptide repeat protein [Chryseobacterium sp. JUb7]MCS3532183.1 tetratricopeptide (TPR) repeat protein [Chryseobacterium sp. JUb7]